MKPYRTGKIEEFRKGEIFVNRVEWEDGRIEIEIHQCSPTLIFRSYLEGDFKKVIKFLEEKQVRELVDVNWGKELLKAKSLKERRREREKETST